MPSFETTHRSPSLRAALRVRSPPMLPGMDVVHIDCECSSFDHTIRFCLDQETGDLWLHTRLTTFLPWYKRIWRAIGYVFRPGRSSQGHYDETYISHADFDRLRALLMLAERCRADSVQDTPRLGVEPSVGP